MLRMLFTVIHRAPTQPGEHHEQDPRRPRLHRINCRASCRSERTRPRTWEPWACNGPTSRLRPSPSFPAACTPPPVSPCPSGTDCVLRSPACRAGLHPGDSASPIAAPARQHRLAGLLKTGHQGQRCEAVTFSGRLDSDQALISHRLAIGDCHLIERKMQLMVGSERNRRWLL